MEQKFTWNQDIDNGKKFFSASKKNDLGFFCTNLSGCGLFYVTAWDRHQLVGTCDFSCKNLASFKYNLKKYLNRNN